MNRRSLLLCLVASMHVAILLCVSPAATQTDQRLFWHPVRLDREDYTANTIGPIRLPTAE